MELRDLVQTQLEFDTAHGWTAKGGDVDLVRATGDDLVGLLGELGEFANIVKKLKLVANRKPSALTGEIAAVRLTLSEELTDSLIYLMRIAAQWNIDLETQYMQKLELNRAKYKEYETAPDNDIE